MTAPPQVSVVIPTHQRAASLRRVIEALGRQDVPGGTFEVVVVCDGLKDPALVVVEDQSLGYSLRLVEQAHQGPAAARNRGVELARGELVLFIDDDVVPAPGLIRAHMDAHGTARDRVVIGPLLPPRGHPSPWVRFEGRTLEDQYRAMEAGEWPVGPRQFYTGNASVRRRHLVEAGGFDAGFRRAEDVELAFRLRDRGVRFEFSRAAEVAHHAQRSYASWVDTGYRYGRADVRMGRQLRRRDVIESAAREFHWRHPLTRGAVRFTLTLPPLGPLVEMLGEPVSLACCRLGAPRLADKALAAVFNIAYWRGVADELGSGSAALRLIELQAVPALSAVAQAHYRQAREADTRRTEAGS